jgi:hypothetical protein
MNSNSISGQPTTINIPPQPGLVAPAVPLAPSTQPAYFERAKQPILVPQPLFQVQAPTFAGDTPPERLIQLAHGSGDEQQDEVTIAGLYEDINSYPHAERDNGIEEDSGTHEERTSRREPSNEEDEEVEDEDKDEDEEAMNDDEILDEEGFAEL